MNSTYDPMKEIVTYPAGYKVVMQNFKGVMYPTTRIRRVSIKIGRNEPCPCGKTKLNADNFDQTVKYKNCHGSKA